MNEHDEERIRATVRDEFKREERKALVKHGCLTKIAEAVIGAAIGGYAGYQVSPTMQGVLVGAGAGAILSTGLWVFL